MQGKTHTVVATATAIMVVKPTNSSDLVMALTFGAIGGLFPDIDIKSSQSSKCAGRIIVALVAALTILSMIDMFYDIGLMKRITNNSNYMRVLIGLVIITCNVAIGKQQPHRAYTHSFLCMISMTIGVGFIVSSAVNSFILGYASHILIDLPNKKNVRLFYPLKGGYCLKLCKSNGYVDTILYCVGMGVTIALSAYIWSIERGMQ